MNPILGLVQTIVIIALMIFLVYKYADIRTKATHFVCPLCNSSFKLSKFNFAFAFKTSVFNERIVTCPVCGYKGRDYNERLVRHYPKGSAFFYFSKNHHMVK